MKARVAIFNLTGRESLWWEHFRKVKKISEGKTVEAVPEVFHAEGVDVLVQGIKKTHSLYNHVIHFIDIEFHVGSVVAVPKTQLSLLQVYVIQDMRFIYKALFTLFCMICQFQN